MEKGGKEGLRPFAYCKCRPVSRRGADRSAPLPAKDLAPPRTKPPSVVSRHKARDRTGWASGGSFWEMLGCAASSLPSPAPDEGSCQRLRPAARANSRDAACRPATAGGIARSHATIVIRELKLIGFLDIRKVVSWRNDLVTRIEKSALSRNVRR